MDIVLKITRYSFLIGRRSTGSSLICRRGCSSRSGNNEVNSSNNEVNSSNNEVTSSNEVFEVPAVEASTPSDSRLGSFAKAFDQMKDMGKEPAPLPPAPPKAPQSFHTLLRNSKLMQLGDPKGKMVVGRVFHVVDNNLFVDFGGKFHAVVSKPERNQELFVRGSLVRLKLEELEMSTRFLGSITDLTLNEADAKLAGLVWSPRGKGSGPARLREKGRSRGQEEEESREI